MSKHTPGRWQLTTVPFELRNTDSAAAIYGPLSKEGGACFIADISRSPGDEEATANAKLIAAAPELLEALKEAVGDVMFEDLPFRIKEKMLAAIKKATE